MKRFSFFLVFLFLGSPSLAAEFTATVTWVVDSDTFHFERANIPDKCRMHGYNAPERDEEGYEELAARARRRLIELVEGKEVLISADERDRYGRLICDVTADGKDVTAQIRELLKNYPGLDKYKALY